jgi:hypothetical protein
MLTLLFLSTLVGVDGHARDICSTMKRIVARQVDRGRWSSEYELNLVTSPPHTGGTVMKARRRLLFDE